MRRILRGAFAGVLATVVMTVVIFAGESLGLLEREPPKEITKRAEDRAGLNPHALPQPAFQASWLAAHFGFGAGAGIVYLIVRPLLPGPATLRGVVYGILVWATNYLGIMPALGFYPSPQRDRQSRAAVLVLAHVIYGAALGRAEG